MMLDSPSKVAGYYKLEAHKLDDRGRILYSKILADWFSNVITDNGLNAMGTVYLPSLFTYCKVGTGTTPPTTADTAMQAFIGATSTIQVSLGQVLVIGPPRYATLSITKRFAAGVATGNLNEVGMGQSSGNTGTLYSRALIVDGAGNPTTVTVLADEVLDVSYELRSYLPELVDVPYSGMVIAGVSYSGVQRPIAVTTASIWNGYANTGAAGVRAYGGLVVGNSGLPVNTASTLPGATSSVDASNLAYANLSLQRDYRATFTLNIGNLTGGINAILAQGAYGYYAYSVTPSIPKTASKSLTLVFRCGPWSRYP